MPDYVAPGRLYHTRDRSRVVEEGDADAAYLVVGKGAVLTETEAKQFAGLHEYLKDYKPTEPAKADEPVVSEEVAEPVERPAGRARAPKGADKSDKGKDE